MIELFVEALGLKSTGAGYEGSCPLCGGEMTLKLLDWGDRRAWEFWCDGDHCPEKAILAAAVLRGANTEVAA
jgi:hypothetical protein